MGAKNLTLRSRNLALRPSFCVVDRVRGEERLIGKEHLSKGNACRVKNES
jgi:hypothetical protein